MKQIVLLFLFAFSTVVNAQIEKVWIGDTALVETWINMPGDTTYHLKSRNGANEWTLFYDVAMSIKAVHVSGFPNYDSCWYRNGQLEQAWYPQPYCSNCASSEGWYPNGQLEYSLKCNSDSCLFLMYYESGQLKRKDVDRIVDSVRQLPHFKIEYHNNGQKLHTPIDYTSDTVITVKYFYESGETMIERQLINGHYYGAFTYWYKSGQVQFTGEYKKKKKPNQTKDSIKVGRWEYFDEAGQLLRVETYRWGKLVKVKEYNGGFPMM